MKKCILPSIFAFGLLVSCNNDDNSSIDNESIVGTWSFVKYQTQFSKDNHIEDEEIDACEEKNTLTFSKDNKYSLITYSADNSGKCVVEDNIDNVTYKVTNKTLIIDWGNDEIHEAEIVKLTKNELILKSDYDEDLDEDGKNEIEFLHLKR
ncbi:lipocalin family protein [Empedobacter brevis]|uniref:lipocalin family protein n=1 Tax=Empedobacter brevis TaxID=247 RepID=UPI0039AF8F0D